MTTFILPAGRTDVNDRKENWPLKKLNGIQRFSDMLLGLEHIVEDMSDNALFIDDMG